MGATGYATAFTSTVSRPTNLVLKCLAARVVAALSAASFHVLDEVLHVPIIAIPVQVPFTIEVARCGRVVGERQRDAGGRSTCEPARLPQWPQ